MGDELLGLGLWPGHRLQRDAVILDFNIVGQFIADEWLSINDGVIIMIFAISACGNGEMASTKLGDIDHKERKILIRDTKTRKEKIASIPSKYSPC